MRNFLRARYEKHNKSISVIYYFLKVCYFVLGRYFRLKEETREAILCFEGGLSKKDYKKLFKKLMVYRYIYCLRAREYYLYDFEQNDYSKRGTFMTRQLTKRYYNVINTSKFRKIFDKKNLSYKVFKKYYKRDLICVNDENDINNFYKFIRNKDKFILKPFSGHSGDGIEIIKVSDYKSKKALFDYTLEKAPYVAEELIKQSNELGQFHPSSVNTVRVVTFYYKEDVSILWAFLRMGASGSVVDNMGSSGLGALIDVKTGIIISDGMDWNGDAGKSHPDSKIKFKGFQIPKWDELLIIVKSLASEVSEMHCIGWDLALTSDGWVLVEGNARPQCVTIQTFTKKGVRPMYDKMYTLIKKDKDEVKKMLEGE